MLSKSSLLFTLCFVPWLLGLALTVHAEESPFGILDPYPFNGPILPVYDSWLAELGCKWLRFGGGILLWDNVEPVKGGGYDWSRPDSYITRAYSEGYEIVISINPFNFWDAISCHTGDDKKDFYKLPCNLTAYSEFVKAAVERYDGDGISDASQSPIVRYWQVYNEPDNTPLVIEDEVIRQGFWTDTPENYALLVQVTYTAVKEASEDAKVLLGGVGNFVSDFAVAMMAELDALAAVDPEHDRYYDIVDLHYFGYTKRYFSNSSREFPDYRQIERIVDSFAPYQQPGVEIWITEIGVYSGDPNGEGMPVQIDIWPYQSERDQASDVLKRYVFSLSEGVKNIFWAGLTEWNNPNINRSFEHVGLIYDGDKIDDLGFGVKKLSYYTYELMVDKLEGSSWDDIKVLINGDDNIYVYQFIKDGLPIFVAWWDYYNDADYQPGEKKSVTIEIGYDEAMLTKAVPRYEYGKDVDKFQSAFDTMRLSGKNGSVKVILDKDPVYIEPILQKANSSPMKVNTPLHFELMQNYPNPFNPDTWIPFSLGKTSDVTICIYNAAGQLVRTLSLKERQAGSYITHGQAAYWNGRDETGQKVASGVYWYTLHAGEFSATRKMVIMK